MLPILNIIRSHETSSKETSNTHLKKIFTSLYKGINLSKDGRFIEDPANIGEFVLHLSSLKEIESCCRQKNIKKEIPLATINGEGHFFLSDTVIEGNSGCGRLKT